MDTLKEKCAAFFSAPQLKMLDKAIDFCKKAHEGQKRDSGEPYFNHPYNVAIMLLELAMDADTIIAGLLHDVVEDNKEITLEIVRDEFSPHIAELVDGVTKLTRTSIQNFGNKQDAQAENVRKMILAMAKDIRVILIKLCDRLHNMRTLEYCRTKKRVEKAKETLEIYAPLAHRLGMGAIKCELEDLSFMHMDPDKFNELSAMVALHREERERMLGVVMDELKARLGELDITAEIHGRPKHLYSIYRKMEAQGISFENLYDLVAIRVVVDTVKECYGVLGIIHTIWKPLPGRFKDYIAVPKHNMYQSLHTTLIGENGIPFEVQIRTIEMHRTAEYGIAAHWKYKEGSGEVSELDSKLAWLRQLMEWQADAGDAGEFMETLKLDFLSDYVYVFTPKGEVFDLANGSTPIDFAYRIHSEVGNHCVGAKINGKMVPLSCKLQTGDIVEILSSSSATPSLDWLKITKTQQAKSKIRQWIKKENKEENTAKGKEMLENAAKRLGFQLSQLTKAEWLEPLLKRYSLPELEDMYAAVGYGGVSTTQIIPKLVEEYRKEHKLEQHMDAEGKPTIAQSGRRTHGVIVEGMENMLVRFSRCCNPVPGDEIVGYITRGRGVSIHRSDCTNLNSLDMEQGRNINVSWATTASGYNASVRIISYERTGLLMDISQVFVGLSISLNTINAKTDKKGMAVIHLMFETKDTAQLNSIIKLLKKIEGTTEVYRVNS